MYYILLREPATYKEIGGGVQCNECHAGYIAVLVDTETKYQMRTKKSFENACDWGCHV